MYAIDDKVNGAATRSSGTNMSLNFLNLRLPCEPKCLCLSMDECVHGCVSECVSICMFVRLDALYR